jgi:serine protease Do
VVPDGPAARAGLLAGDVLLSVGGQTVRAQQDLQEVLRKLEPGKPVVVVVLRDGTEVTVTITLGE